MTTVIASIDQQQARALTDRIKVAVEATWVLIQEAYTSRAWAVLGYDSWDAYCAREFGSARLRLPREERQEVVASLRDSGLSIRAIASATGVARNTVRDDLREVGQFDPPGQVTGSDGKTYPTAQPGACPDEFAGSDWVEPDEDPTSRDDAQPQFSPRPEPTVEPAKPKRRPLPEAFAEATLDLARTAERLGRLREDDRFNRNRDQTHHQMAGLITALEHTAELLQAMNLPETTASEEARRWWATSLNTISDALAGVASQLTKEQ